MAILINGNGNPAIYPDQDADWFASIFGGQTAITGVGSQFAAEIQDANTIAVADGVIITKEGRRIQLDANQSDIFEIPTGAQGTTNYYIIGYCLTTNDDSSQTAETFVQLMENATDTIDEDTFRDGADKVYVSLYRVTQTGFTLETPELLLPQVESITQLNADLTANSKKYSASYQNGKYGFMIDNVFYEIGGDVMPALDFANPLHTFSSGNLSYTATQECYLCGDVNGGGIVNINGVGIQGSLANVYTYISPLKLSAGDIVTTTTTLSRLHVFKKL